MVIFERSTPNRNASAQIPKLSHHHNIKLNIPQALMRKNPAKLPECSELEVIRHYTNLSSKNFAIDKNFYPLGSCTMKYNPRGVHKATSLSQFSNQHPLAPAELCQGTLEILYNFQQYLAEITGMDAVSLSPMAGSQGEFTGVAMIKAYHAANNQSNRNEMLIPDAAHGTNPASAAMCGFKIIEIPTAPDGDLDLEVLAQHLGPNTAGIMLTNPSTLGLFIKKIIKVAEMVHQAGGLLYYDGANLNAILGKIRPGDMGFDVMHMNVHKTFATPHGGGGPGAGPVAVNKKLMPFLPVPTVIKEDDQYRLSTLQDYPHSIGRLSAFNGNTGILLRAYFYIMMLGKDGLQNVSDYATLNANYLLHKLMELGYTAAYPTRRASHEFIISLQHEKKQYNVSAMDVAKALLDRGFHAPTTYFPLLIPECLLIEPTETESKQELDRFLEAMREIRQLIISNPSALHQAPSTLPVSRLDDVKAAKDLDLKYKFHNQIPTEVTA